MTVSNSLELSNLHRVFGDKVALDDVSLTLRAGEIVCLLGPNGAGKTTTIKIASTLLAPTRGSVIVRGIDATKNPRMARAHIGLALGGDRGFYMRATVIENLRFFGELKGVTGRRRDDQITRLLNDVGLATRGQSKVEELSRGMRQRLDIARALLGDPAVILLDEPSSGLDPESARSMRELVADLRRNGSAILLTTHHMQEAEALADRILLLNQGRVSVEGKVEDISNAAGISAVSTYRLSSFDASSVDRIREGIRGVIGVFVDERNGAWTLDVVWSTDAPDYKTVLKILDTSATHVVTRPPTLEEAYLGFLERRQSRKTTL